MPGFGLAHHQVARHEVAVHRDARLASALATSRSHTPCHCACWAALQPMPCSRPTHHSRKERQFAPQQGIVVGRQAGRIDPLLPLQQRAEGVAHQGVGAPRLALAERVAKRGEVRPRAEVGQEQEAMLDVLRQHAWCIEPGLLDQLRHVHEGPHVLLRRRRVHHDEASIGARRCAGSGESSRRRWPAAGWPGPAGARRASRASARRPRGERDRPTPRLGRGPRCS